MKLCLPLIASLVLAAGCKTDKADSSAPSSASDTTEPSSHGRSGKIDMPKQRPPSASGEAPALPDDEDAGSAAQSDEDRRARREERRKERMAEIDTDGDGQISEAERKAAAEKRLEQMQKRMDTNGDGKLTVQELQDSRMARRMGDVSAIDTDKDGVVSPAEMQKAMEDMRVRGWGGRDGFRPRRGDSGGDTGSGSAQ